MIVRLICAESDLRLLLRPTRDGSGEWKGMRFSSTASECDACVVFESVPAEVELECPPKRVLFFCGEPPEVRAYEPAFLAQFSRVVTSDEKLAHPGRVLRAAGHPWHLGAYLDPVPDRSRLAGMAAGAKPRMLSVICSDKAFTTGHRLRLEYVCALKEELGPLLEVFGRGVRTLADKAEAIAPFRYHVAIENCVRQDYWTEKIADPLLGGAFPFYVGAPNLTRYFPADSFVALPGADARAAARLIRAEIARDRAASSAAAVAEARRRLLESHHLPAVAAELIAGIANPGPRTRIRLRPERPLPAGWLRRLRERLDRAGRRRAERARLRLTEAASRG